MSTDTLNVFEKTPVSGAVLKNAIPAMAAMLMVLIYNLADTFFIGQTHDDLQVAAVSLATPVFLIFMAVGTIFGIGGTSVISRALGEGRKDYAKKVCAFCMWSCVAVGIVMSLLFLLFMDRLLALVGASADTWDYARTYLTIVSLSGPFVLIANCYSNVIRAEGQSGRAGFSFDERIQHCDEQPDGEVRRHGPRRCGSGYESNDDDRHGMYRSGAGCAAAPWVLRGGEKVGQV